MGSALSVTRPHKRTIVLLEGNIGAGKSTLLSLLKQRLPACIVVPEPVNEWLKNDVLRKSYEEPHQNGNAYKFQTLALSTRLIARKTALDTNPDCDLFFCERAGIADHVFVDVNAKSGNLTSDEVQLYDTFYQALLTAFGVLDNTTYNTKVLYLRTSVDECVSRIKARQRKHGEDSIPKKYLEEIEKGYDVMISTLKSTLGFEHVLCVDGDGAFDPRFLNDIVLWCTK